MNETKTVEERTQELWEIERQQREEDRGGDFPDMPERLAAPDYLTPAQRREDRKKTEPEFLHIEIKGHVITTLDAFIFGAGFVSAVLLMIIF